MILYNYLHPVPRVFLHRETIKRIWYTFPSLPFKALASVLSEFNPPILPISSTIIPWLLTYTSTTSLCPPTKEFSVLSILLRDQTYSSTMTFTYWCLCAYKYVCVYVFVYFDNFSYTSFTQNIHSIIDQLHGTSRNFRERSSPYNWRVTPTPIPYL